MNVVPKSNSATRPSGAPKSRARQRWELRQLTYRCFLKPTEYTLYGFHERDKDYGYMMNFMTVNTLRNKFRGAVNDPNWKPVLDNKWLFHLHYERLDIPVPELHGIYDRGTGFTRTGKPLASPGDLLSFFRENRPSTLVVKPLGGIMGKEVLILDEIHYEGDEIRLVTNTGEKLTFDQLAEKVDRPPKVRYYMAGGYELSHTGYLLEGKLQQHDFLNEIAPYTTNTIRVVTFLDHDNQVDVHFTILRLGRRGNVADNWDRGGVSVAVDAASGVLGEGVVKPKYGGEWMQTHPDSGVRFTGKTLPHWNEILDVCTRAAKVTPGVRSVGWDVALTPAGPVIIEGNPDWDLPMVQVHTEGFLQPRVREQLAHFGLTFPENNLPPFSLRDWRIHKREQARERAFHRSGV